MKVAAGGLDQVEEITAVLQNAAAPPPVATSAPRPGNHAFAMTGARLLSQHCSRSDPGRSRLS